MKKLLVRIDKDELSAITELESYGKLEKVSFLLNLFSVEGENLSIKKISKIKGVMSIEEDRKGELMLA